MSLEGAELLGGGEGKHPFLIAILQNKYEMNI